MMVKEETAKALTYLGLAYNKEYTPAECEVYHDFLGGYSYDVMKQAINNIIRSSTYVPRINQLIEACESVKKETRLQVLEFMASVGYFESYSDKATAEYLVACDEAPKKLQKDMNHYYTIMINPAKQLECKQMQEKREKEVQDDLKILIARLRG